MKIYFYLIMIKNSVKFNLSLSVLGSIIAGIIFIFRG